VWSCVGHDDVSEPCPDCGTEFRPLEYDTFIDGLECQVVRRGGHCGAGAELSWQPFLTLAEFDPDEVKRIARLLNDAEVLP